MSVNLGAHTATGIKDASNNGSFTNIENVIGGGAGDTLIGDGVANKLTGGGGNDTLIGSGGNDTAVYTTDAHCDR